MHGRAKRESLTRWARIVFTRLGARQTTKKPHTLWQRVGPLKITFEGVFTKVVGATREEKAQARCLYEWLLAGSACNPSFVASSRIYGICQDSRQNRKIIRISNKHVNARAQVLCTSSPAPQDVSNHVYAVHLI